MIKPESYLSLFKSIGLRPFIFPNDIKTWKIHTNQIDALQQLFGPPIKQELPNHGVKALLSTKAQLTLIPSNFDSGLLITSKANADYLIPRLRTYGFSEELFYWFLAIDKEETLAILDKQEHHRVPTTLEGKLFLLHPSKSILFCMESLTAIWFRNEKEFQLYSDWFLDFVAASF
ncbi:MAG: hypothetical protein AAF587_42665 [Bacteroidota bacterium]